MEAALKAGENEGGEHGAHPTECQDEAVTEGRGVQVVSREEREQCSERRGWRDVESGAGGDGSEAWRVREVPPAGRDGAHEALSGRGAWC